MLKVGSDVVKKLNFENEYTKVSQIDGEELLGIFCCLDTPE